MFSYKKVTCVAVALAASLALPACSVAGDAAGSAKSVLQLLRDDPAKSLRTAVDKTADVTSATMKMSGTEGGDKQDMTIKARFGAKPAAEMTALDDGKPMTIFVEGTVFLVGLSAEDATGPFAGKKWLKMDMATMPKDKAKELDLDPETFASELEELNPKKQLQQMIDIADLKVAGEETVDGAKTIHYTSTTTAAKALARMTAKDRADSEKKYTAAKVKDVTVDVWVDEKYQLRQAKFHAGTVDDWTAHYSEYNSTVLSPAPPAAEVADFADLIKQLEGIAG